MIDECAGVLRPLVEGEKRDGRGYGSVARSGDRPQVGGERVESREEEAGAWFYGWMARGAERLSGMGGRMADTQPVLTALQVALARLWLSWGIEPEVMIGHSAGEIALAHVAGVFGLADALKLAAVRGRLMDEVPAGGTMMAVSAADAVVRDVIEPFGERVSLAALNGPDSVVVSGEIEALTAVAAQFAAKQIKTRMLAISCASHSPLMRPMVAAFQEVLAGIRFSPPKRKLVSTLTGAIAGDEIATSQYWVEHILRPVRFAAAVAHLPTLKIDTLIEIGPKPTLLGLTRRCLPEMEGNWLPSLKADVDDRYGILGELGQHYVTGGQVKWGAVYGAQTRVATPLYPFQRQRYWVAERLRRRTVGDSAVVQALESGDETALRQQLAKRLSSAEQAMLPKLLHLLRDLHQGESETVPGLYDFVWEAKRPTGWLPAPAFMPTPADLYGAVERYMAGINETAEVQAYIDFLDQLDRVSVGYIVQAWQALGGVWAVGERFTTADFVAQRGIEAKQWRMVGRLLEILAEEGVLRPLADGGWLIEKEPDEAQFVGDGPLSSSIEAELLARCGRGLAAVLRGEQDPLALLFPAGNERTAAVLYGDAWGARVLNDLLGQAVKQIVERRPQGRYLRVLEIGAGTGGATQAILPLLPSEHVDYTFSDISPIFLRQAENRFGDTPFVSYQKLDIERDPAAQGFDGAQFDVVIGANVLHATRNLPQALAHARSLLAPQGELLLLEGLRPMRWLDLIFGLTDGWWHWEDEVAEGACVVDGRGVV